MTNGNALSSALRRAAVGLSLLAMPLVVFAGPITDNVPLNTPILGGRMFVASDGDVTVTAMGGDAAYTGSLFVYSVNSGRRTIFDSSAAVGSQINIGSYAAGTELVFGYAVNNTGKTYLTGPASANGDGKAHAQAVTTLDASLNQYMTSVGIEDLWGGGDADYNDFQFMLSNVVDPGDVLAAQAAVPEPGPLALLGIGGLVFGFMGHRARKRR